MRGEFDFINYIKERHKLKAIGDDCSVIPTDGLTDQLFTVDLLIENVDFRLDWTTPSFLGHKALAVSLSDVAAMGGTPKFALLSLGLPDSLWKTSFLDEFYEGWHSLAGTYGVELAGGDISKAGELVIDSFVIGEVPRGKALLRSGAKPGDLIFVTGELGGASLGLSLLENGMRPGDELADFHRDAILRQLKPTPQVAIGKSLLENQLATSAIDLSDGISSDLFHICQASNVGAILDASNLPIAKEATLEMALNGGEDFELLFTVPPERRLNAQQLGCTEVGKIADNSDGIRVQIDSETRPLVPRGFEHFRRQQRGDRGDP
ncbi:MAG: Thiamine-monophosphate kinase [Pyrinomonadaceae bacterium]|nr:Thiamine-monophosphate kinase [Pyrinomonadaceae bacterium]